MQLITLTSFEVLICLHILALLVYTEMNRFLMIARTITQNIKKNRLLEELATVFFRISKRTHNTQRR